MTANAITNVAIIFGATVMTMIGAMHMAMPTIGYEPSVRDALAPGLREHFYYLGTYAIGGFLFALAGLSLLALGTARAWLASGLLAALWGARSLLEVLYPVELPLFILAHPHPVLLTVMLILTTFYALGALAPAVFVKRRPRGASE